MKSVVATGWEPGRISENEIADGEAYHRALYINGDIGRPANWHRESAERLVQLVVPNIKDGSLVVDYGWNWRIRNRIAKRG